MGRKIVLKLALKGGFTIRTDNSVRDTLTISALARHSGVPSKTIRFWERLGLLPKAARTHTGYRVFSPESMQYVAFIKKSKAIGLTLAEMREILRLTRTGHCPCPDVARWSREKERAAKEQMRSLTALIERLKSIRRACARGDCSHQECGEVCYLIQELPEGRSFKGGKCNEKTMDRCERCCGATDGVRVARGRSGVRVLSSRMSALPVQVGRRRTPKD